MPPLEFHWGFHSTGCSGWNTSVFSTGVNTPVDVFLQWPTEGLPENSRRMFGGGSVGGSISGGFRVLVMKSRAGGNQL